MDEAGSGADERRAVRSFVRRAGRLTSAQRRALEGLWPRFGLVPEGWIEPEAVFGRKAPCHLEIGFGMGDALLELAVRHPEVDYLGIEVYEPGIGRVLNGLAEAALDNVRVLRGDAVEVLERHVRAETLQAVLVFFPDPWPKKRHHKRRLIQPAFVSLLVEKLAPGGRLYLATDWEDYASAMLETLEAEPGLGNLAGPGRFSPRPPARPVTKFETRGRRLGHSVWDLGYEKRGGGTAHQTPSV